MSVLTTGLVQMKTDIMETALSAQEVWHLCQRLAAERLGKGADCNAIRAENLVAQIKQASGEVQLA